MKKDVHFDSKLLKFKQYIGYGLLVWILNFIIFSYVNSIFFNGDNFSWIFFVIYVLIFLASLIFATVNCIRFLVFTHNHKKIKSAKLLVIILLIVCIAIWLVALSSNLAMLLYILIKGLFSGALFPV